MADTVCLALDDVFGLSVRVLREHGMSLAHAEAVARVITAGERDECYSHGIYRLLITTHTLSNSSISRDALPVMRDRTPALVGVDAQFAYSPLSFEMGSEVLIEKARKTGIAAMVINNCYHFSALWPEIEVLTAAGLAAIAMNPSHAGVAPAGGTQAVLGTNPIAFGWPRPGKDPYVFDFATSAVARGEIELHNRSGKAVPFGWGIDALGQPTSNANSILNGGAMLAFGGHKGSALSTMIELLAGPLIGDLTSLDSLEYDDGQGASPCHGELVIAMDPLLLGQGQYANDTARAERLFDAFLGQGARLPSQRRFAARKRSLEHGVQVPRALYEEITNLLSGSESTRRAP
ncbi:Ldh family oxidoreductase [Ottowia thiooxydans]|uniref:Ldh family oxidoreductase n=1 Tax=Ottowia thiooxydans TaxID=219182 RepID=UPI0003FFFA6F|nr:Ldh family oxidoreductase [Ottowia thiooxydans]